MQEMHVRSLRQEDSLEKEMATLSSILHAKIISWKIPLSKERGRLQFLGSQRIGQDLVTEWS